MPTVPKVSPQSVAYVIAVIGACVGLAGGRLLLTSPEAFKCATDLAACQAVVPLKDEALASCNATLDKLTGGKP